MAKKKQLTVSDILNVMGDSQPVVCSFTAYGVPYADSYTDGMRTAKDCKEQLRYDCLNALVTGIGYATAGSAHEPQVNRSDILTSINGEIVH